MPHFDRVADFAGAEMFRAILAAAPPDTTLVGVDEDTALVCLPTAEQRWQVFGRQTVSVFDRQGGRAIYRAGDAVSLRAL
jgi:cyanophycinase-like exopeptidase